MFVAVHNCVYFDLLELETGDLLSEVSYDPKKLRLEDHMNDRVGQVWEYHRAFESNSTRELSGPIYLVVRRDCNHYWTLVDLEDGMPAGHVDHVLLDEAERGAASYWVRIA